MKKSLLFLVMIDNPIDFFNFLNVEYNFCENYQL